MRHRISAALAVFIGAASLVAAAAVESPVISSETDLVRVSVSVTDERGQPVTDLRADDFVLTDDGRPQSITHFVPPTGTAVPAATPAGPAEVPAAPAAAPTPLPRRVVLAIDDLHVSASSLARARPALKRLVETELAPTDEVAVVAMSGGGMTRAFTASRPALLSAIDGLRSAERRPNAGGRSTMNQSQAEAIDRRDQVALELAAREIAEAAGAPTNPPPPWAFSEAAAQARQMIAQAFEASNAALSRLEDVVRNLAGLPGRKLVVVLSDGFSLGPASDPAAFDLRRLADACARADAIVYSLQARGLVTSMAGAESPGAGVSPVSGQRQSYAAQERVAFQMALSSVAEATGGDLIREGNDLDAGLRHILDDSLSTYVLGYSPAAQATDSRFHAIEVKVPARRALRIRARRGYFAGRERRANEARSPEERRQVEIRDALSSIVERRDLPLRMRADVIERPPGRPELIVSAFLDARAVPFKTTGERRQAELEFARVVADERGKVVAPAEGNTATLDLGPAAYEKTLAEGLSFQSTVPLEPGRYEVRMAVREGRSGQIGTAREWVEVPDRRQGGLSLSGLFLFADPTGKGDEAALRNVQATRAFGRGEALYYAVHVYNPARDTAGAADVVAQAQIRRGGQLQGASPVEAVPFPAAQSAHSLRGRIALEGLEGGEYELRLVVVDRRAGVQAERSIDFSVD